MKTKTIKQIRKDLDELVKVQCSDGNWNYDPYMHGLANGMLLAQSLMSGYKIEYKPLSAPKRWLKDKSLLHKIKWFIYFEILRKPKILSVAKEGAENVKTNYK